MTRTNVVLKEGGNYVSLFWAEERAAMLHVSSLVEHSRNPNVSDEYNC